VGYGPDPNAVVARTRRLTDAIIRGNHDKACAGLSDAEDFNVSARLTTFWTRQALTPENFRAFCATFRRPPADGRLELVHGSQTDEDEYIIGPTEALPALKNAYRPACVLWPHSPTRRIFLRPLGPASRVWIVFRSQTAKA